jgi:signal transduction histidine kinase
MTPEVSPPERALREGAGFQLPPPALDEAVPVAFAGVVHDLGNLIQIASSVLSLVSRSPDMPAARRDPMLVKASASLDHAGALVRQTLRVARGSGGGPRQASVAACLFDIRSLIEDLWGPAFRLDIWIEVNLPKVRCEQLSLQNAILNLVYNARDAMADGGAVAVRAGRVAAGATREMVEISVADAGIGMTPETIARAFEPFFTTKSEGMGGVGLPMVERFVRAAGGEIAVESEVGAGTTVRLRLPAIPRAAGEGEIASRAPEEGTATGAVPRVRETVRRSAGS